MLIVRFNACVLLYLKSKKYENVDLTLIFGVDVVK